MAAIFLTALKRGVFSDRKRDLERQIARLEKDIGDAWESNLISKAKAFEWLANLRFSIYSLRRAFRVQQMPTSSDEMFRYLQQAVAARRGGGTSVFLYDAIYQFALEGADDIKSEFRRIVLAGAQGATDA